MALLSRLKTWVSGEILTASDLNAEFDNIINSGLDADNVVGSSSNVTEMRVTTDPGEVGTESLASNVDGELKRLRNIIKEITGKTQWYETPPRDIDTGNLAVATADINNDAVTTAKILNANVTRAKLEALGHQVSTSSGSFSTSSATFVDVTNLSVTITTSGRPVMLMMVGDGTGNTRVGVSDTTSPGETVEGRLKLVRDVTDLSILNIQLSASAGTQQVMLSPVTPTHFDPVGAGTYTYKVQAALDAGDSIGILRYQLVAYEL